MQSQQQLTLINCTVLNIPLHFLVFLSYLHLKSQEVESAWHFASHLSYVGYRSTIICMSPSAYAAGYKKKVQSPLISALCHFFHCCHKSLFIINHHLHFLSQSISHILQQRIISDDMKSFWKTEQDFLMPKLRTELKNPTHVLKNVCPL